MAVARIRLGIIGTGLAIEKLHWPALRQLTQHFEVVAFANHTRPKAEAFARSAGLGMDGYCANYADLLARPDVDAVLIALPIPLLYPAARDALRAGKHVLCEKPAGADLDQARQFVGLAGEFPQLKVLIGENFFYRDDLRLALSLLEAGAIGRVHLMSWRVVMHAVPREGNYTSTPWRQVPEYRGGPQLDAGVHHVAQMRLLCGDVQQLHGATADANPTMGGPSDLVLSLRFASQVVGSFAAGHLAIPTPGEPNEMRVYGSEGSLALANRAVRVQRADGSPVEQYEFQSDGGYYNQLLNFYDAIVHDEQIVGTIAQSVANLLVVMSGLDSAEQGRVVDVGQRQQDEAGLAPSERPLPLWRPRGASDLFAGLPCQVQRTESAPA